MNQLKTISTPEAVVLGSRILAISLTVYALAALANVPETVYSFRHYSDEIASTAHVEYMRHLYLILLGFQITRIIGYSLMAAWLFRCGPDIEELLLPAHLRDKASE